MRVVVQRVAEASVIVAQETVGAIGRGLVIFVAVAPDDDDAAVSWMAKKCAQLRIFPDSAGKMNRSLKDEGLDALVVSQFTLLADVHRGNRPSYVDAADPDVAEPMYEKFVKAMGAELGRPVARGRFRAEMLVRLANDGPVTICIDKPPVDRDQKAVSVNAGPDSA